MNIINKYNVITKWNNVPCDKFKGIGLHDLFFFFYVGLTKILYYSKYSIYNKWFNLAIL